ncbi:hypothetical protein ACWEOI_12685 [Nocardia sp. NPDC004340]
MSDLLVVVDGEGNIRAASSLRPPDNFAAAAATFGRAPEAALFLPVRVEAGPGESLHSVPLPEELRAAGSLATLGNYQIEMHEGAARLGARRP